MAFLTGVELLRRMLAAMGIDPKKVPVRGMTISELEKMLAGLGTEVKVTPGEGWLGRKTATRPHRCVCCGTAEDYAAGVPFVLSKVCGCQESKDEQPNMIGFAGFLPASGTVDGFFGDVPIGGHSAAAVRQTAKLDQILDCTCPTPTLMTSGCQCGAMKKEGKDAEPDHIQAGREAVDSPD